MPILQTCRACSSNAAKLRPDPAYKIIEDHITTGERAPCRVRVQSLLVNVFSSEMDGESISQHACSFSNSCICSVVSFRTLELRRNWSGSPKLLIPAFTIVGAAMAIVHHEVYVYLDGTKVDAKFGPYGQVIVPALGTFLAYIGHTVLAAAIGLAFVQAIWWRFRTRGHSIERINAIISCQQSPFTPSALPAWSFSTISLTVIAAFANFMAVITIFAPGALSIISGTENLPCIVRVPDLAPAHVGSITNPASNVLSFAIRAVIQGYLPPFRQCNQTCYFDVDYAAPALSCTDITSSADFGTLLPTNILWKSSYEFNSTGLYIQAAMVTNAETGQKGAVACTASSASYSVRIGNSGNSSTITLLDSPKTLNPLTTSTPDPTTNTTASAMDALADALAFAISGSINNAQDHFSWDSSIIQYTWMLYDAYHWNRTQDLMWILPSLMENVSLSIASGFLDLDNYPSTMATLGTTCVYSVNVYTYNSKHLLLAYGSCLAVSLICALVAMWAIHHNGDEFLDFARVLEAIPGQGLASHLGKKAKLEVDNSGVFRLTTEPPGSKETQKLLPLYPPNVDRFDNRSRY